MITEKDLQEAIAECQGDRNPDSRTCIKLAAFYIIKDHLFPEGEKVRADMPSYSFAPPPEEIETAIDYSSDSEFGKAVEGRQASEVWPLIDELVTTIQVIMPRIYDSFMRKLQ